ncbi:MAG: stage V sporulation protein AB [Lachnospiraceae bacterium]|nr:stage V sporulation protein AB [Lachnospiraceae bacterium]
MTDFLKQVFMVLMAFASGIAVSAGIFAFIAVIGIVPRIAWKTKTIEYIPFYEDAITLGGIFGCTTMLINYKLPFGEVFTAAVGFAVGIFIGCLAVSLAEVLNVMPIFTRRFRIINSIVYMIFALALGKAVGSLLYFFVPGFYRNF